MQPPCCAPPQTASFTSVPSPLFPPCRTPGSGASCLRGETSLPLWPATSAAWWPWRGSGCCCMAGWTTARSAWMTPGSMMPPGRPCLMRHMLQSAPLAAQEGMDMRRVPVRHSFVLASLVPGFSRCLHGALSGSRCPDLRRLKVRLVGLPPERGWSGACIQARSLSALTNLEAVTAPR